MSYIPTINNQYIKELTTKFGTVRYTDNYNHMFCINDINKCIDGSSYDTNELIQMYSKHSLIINHIEGTSYVFISKNSLCCILDNVDESFKRKADELINQLLEYMNIKENCNINLTVNDNEVVSLYIDGKYTNTFESVKSLEDFTKLKGISNHKYVSQTHLQAKIDGEDTDLVYIDLIDDNDIEEIYRDYKISKLLLSLSEEDKELIKAKL